MENFHLFYPLIKKTLLNETNFGMKNFSKTETVPKNKQKSQEK